MNPTFFLQKRHFRFDDPWDVKAYIRLKAEKNPAVSFDDPRGVKAHVRTHSKKDPYLLLDDPRGVKGTLPTLALLQPAAKHTLSSPPLHFSPSFFFQFPLFYYFCPIEAVK